MREVLLVRHGEAAPEGAAGDAARPLTAEGRAAAAMVGAGLRELGFAPQVGLASPYLRAQQTAALIGAPLGLAFLAEALLTPGGSPARAAALIRALDAPCGLVVSHLPLLPSLVEALGGPRLPFGTASVAHLVLEDGAARVAGHWHAGELVAPR